MAKFKIGDRVVVTLAGLQRDARSIPAHMGYTREHRKYRALLSDLRRSESVGVVSHVFPSGGMNVDFDGRTFHIEPSMVAAG
jgi:hypothetical protein